jgi:hypothetical protein
MQITVNTYADFVTAVKAVSGVDVVFYWDDSPSSFKVQAIMRCGHISTAFSTGLTSKPGSFDTDFPDAVELPDNFGVSA